MLCEYIVLGILVIILPIASYVGNVEMNLNDCIAYPEGRLLAGSCFHNPSGKHQLGQLLHMIEWPG